MLALRQIGKYYYIEGRIAGKRVRKSTKKTELIEAQVELAKFIIDEETRLTNKPTRFNELVTIYRNGKSRARKELTSKADSQLRLVDELFGADLLSEFETFSVSEKLDEELWNRADGTKKRYMSTIISVWNYAAKRSYVPFMKFECEYRDGRVDDFINADERELLLEHMSAINEMAALVMEFLFATGLRYSEMRGLVDSDEYKGELTVCNHKGYRGAELKRVIPMNARARKGWVRLRGDFGSLSPTTGWLRHVLRTACEQVGTKMWRVHDARHSYASLLVNGGASLLEVARLLGHSEVRTTERYAKADKGRLREVVELLF